MSQTLAMFPLGSVLLPGMPVVLRVFEARFLAMLAEISVDGPAEFGVVLIERGSEVGGADVRFDVGTLARVVQLEPGEASVGIVAIGGRRVRVTHWLSDDPYPRAEVEVLPDLLWVDAHEPLLAETLEIVRSARHDLQADAEELTLPDDAEAACWQLAAAAPVGPLDRLEMLRATDVEELLRTVAERTRQVVALHEAFGA